MNVYLTTHSSIPFGSNQSALPPWQLATVLITKPSAWNLWKKSLPARSQVWVSSWYKSQHTIFLFGRLGPGTPSCLTLACFSPHSPDCYIKSEQLSKYGCVWREAVILMTGIAVHLWEVFRGNRTVTASLRKKGFSTAVFHSQDCLPFLLQYFLQQMNGELSPFLNAWESTHHVINWSIYHLRTPLKISESHNYWNTECNYYCSYIAYMWIHAAPQSLNLQEMKENSFSPLSCTLFHIAK